MKLESYGMKWTNEFMERDTAIRLADEFNRQAYSTDRYQIPGQIAWALFNYGYSTEYLFNLKYKDINWNKIETQDKPNFMQDYKKQLIAKLTK